MSQSPQQYAPSSNFQVVSNAKIIILVLVALLAICMVGCGLLAALLLPAVAAARDAARLQRTSNNMREIGLALLNYESTYKSFPAIHSINHDKVPTMSWRYAISPFLGSEGSRCF